MNKDCRNQIDVAMDIRTILEQSGLKYDEFYDGEVHSYTFVLFDEED